MQSPIYVSVDGDGVSQSSLWSVYERRFWSASGRDEVKTENDFVSQPSPGQTKASRRNPEGARQYRRACGLRLRG